LDLFHVFRPFHFFSSVIFIAHALLHLLLTYRVLGRGEGSGGTDKGKGGKELHLDRVFPGKYGGSTSVLELCTNRVTMAAERFASTAEGSTDRRGA
jgi:hypothetical protein